MEPLCRERRAAPRARAPLAASRAHARNELRGLAKAKELLEIKAKAKLPVEPLMAVRTKAKAPTGPGKLVKPRNQGKARETRKPGKPGRQGGPRGARDRQQLS